VGVILGIFSQLHKQEGELFKLGDLNIDDLGRLDEPPLPSADQGGL